MSDELPIEEILKWPELADVREELADPRYANRRHGSRATYALKCHGPLCKYGERMNARKRRMKLAVRQGRLYEEGWTRKHDRDELLAAIIKWHAKKMLEERLSRGEQAV